jgi:KDO2-lipid IV(A) lauroyltransferase
MERALTITYMSDVKKSAWKRFRHGLLDSRLLYWVVAGGVFFIDILPLGLSRLIGRICGWLAWRLDRGHRALCLDNLAIAFPEKSESERRAILKKSYVHMGLCAVDFCQFRSVTPDELLNQWVEFEAGSPERLRSVISQDKGLIAIGAHIGFWELSGIINPVMGNPTISIARQIPSPLINGLVTHIRSRLGNEIVWQEGALRPMLRALRDKKTVGVIADHYASRESPWIPFFSREASTVDTCAKLHMKTGAPMVVNVLLRQPDGRYLFRCRHIDVPPRGTESEDERVCQILRMMNKEFEDALRLVPEQWLWMHKRWKPKPAPQPAETPRATNFAAPGAKPETA